MNETKKRSSLADDLRPIEIPPEVKTFCDRLSHLHDEISYEELMEWRDKIDDPRK